MRLSQGGVGKGFICKYVVIIKSSIIIIYDVKMPTGLVNIEKEQL